jgi:aspartate racemase
MEGEFYCGRLREKHGLEVLLPGEEARTAIHSVIYEGLCRGVVEPDSKRAYLRIIRNLIERGAEGVILGCTEIMLLIQQDDLPVPTFDTTALHATAAVDLALDVG